MKYVKGSLVISAAAHNNSCWVSYTGLQLVHIQAPLYSVVIHFLIDSFPVTRVLSSLYFLIMILPKLHF